MVTPLILSAHFSCSSPPLFFLQALYQALKSHRSDHPDAVTDESEEPLSQTLPMDVRGLAVRVDGAPSVRTESHAQWDIDAAALTTGAAQVEDEGSAEIMTGEESAGGSNVGMIVGVVLCVGILAGGGALLVMSGALLVMRLGASAR
jgi:hypothetical protein